MEKQSVYFLPLVAPVLRAPASCLNKRHKANETKKGKLVANSSLTSQHGSTVHSIITQALVAAFLRAATVVRKGRSLSRRAFYDACTPRWPAAPRSKQRSPEHSNVQ